MWRGYAHERRGNVVAALRDYEQAARLQPNDTVVRDSARRMRSAQR
ncbi:MAG: tetratricopeptide repeat protein [Xanthobacteraceae bacterium]